MDFAAHRLSDRSLAARSRLAARPHRVLLVLVGVTLATEPFVRAQLVVGVAIAATTLANALVHPYTVPWGWEAASAVMFLFAVTLTTWLVAATREPTRVPP